MTLGGIEQDTCPDHVGREERGRPGDRAIDVALGGEVDHDVVAGDHLVDQLLVTDVAVDELMIRDTSRARPTVAATPA